MDAERERLLQTRSDDLQREYENLVRSLDAAYETIRAINCALTENRSESRKIFQERLMLVSPEASIDSPPPLTKRTCNSPPVYVRNIKDEASNTITPSLIYEEASDGSGDDDEAICLGANDSYAVSDTDDEADNFSLLQRFVRTDRSTSLEPATQLSDPRDAEGAAAAPPQLQRAPDSTANGKWRTPSGLSATGNKPLEPEPVDLDLSIIKTEWPDKSTVSKASVQDVAENKSLQMKQKRKIKVTAKAAAFKQALYKGNKELSEEEKSKKRAQTRDRMRRWRAKKRLQQQFVNHRKCKVKEL